ncbi:potassium-transporting ATPase subunit C, partial [Xanthomonas sp. Kuri4-1]
MNLSTTAATDRDAPPPPLRDEGRWRGALGLAAVTLLGFGLAYALVATG